MNRMVDRAGALAIGILDRATGEHSQRIVVWLAARGASPERLAVAWLHDVLEDAPETPLRGFPEEVLNAVGRLTRTEGEPYEEYIESIAHAGGIARDVKIADLLDNLYGRPEPAPEDLAKRYHDALRRLWTR